MSCSLSSSMTVVCKSGVGASTFSESYKGIFDIYEYTEDDFMCMSSDEVSDKLVAKWNMRPVINLVTYSGDIINKLDAANVPFIMVQFIGDEPIDEVPNLMVGNGRYLEHVIIPIICTRYSCYTSSNIENIKQIIMKEK